MKTILTLLLALLYLSASGQTQNPKLPQALVGHFTDDYQIKYEVSDSLWIQKPNIKYHILKIDTVKQYILLKNDQSNKFDAGLYTRIDYMYFQNMQPYNWGFCLTNYQAKNMEEAEATANADRNNPKKGCNGYPFSRMALIKP